MLRRFPVHSSKHIIHDKLLSYLLNLSHGDRTAET